MGIYKLNLETKQNSRFIFKMYNADASNPSCAS